MPSLLLHIDDFCPLRHQLIPSFKTPPNKIQVSNYTVTTALEHKRDGRSFDLPGKLFYYTKETQDEGKRENTFIFSIHKIIPILLCAKCISLLLFFGGRHLTHCSMGDIKNKTAAKHWERKLNWNCISSSSSCFLFL